ncbi:hypothetical protein [Streptomyces melanogenes]|uniref:hypothetical protein n=1 Tax=Streptomyces melanogenes TaxID=67326 RepID=UPI0037B4F7F1
MPAALLALGIAASPAASSPSKAADSRVTTYYWLPGVHQLSVREHFPCQAHEWRWPSNPIDFVNNGECGRQVWLIENVTGSGYKACIGPGQALYIPDWINHPSILRVGPFQPCP